MTDILVIGAGVIGLSAAVALLRAGHGVTVYAAEPPDRTTSAVAGALWGPHLVGADDRVERWAGLTLNHFRELAARSEGGVAVLPGLVASAADHDTEPPSFTKGAGQPAQADPASLPPGYASGWRYHAPVVDMPVYLEHLLAQLSEHGGRMEVGPALPDLATALGRWPAARVVVNCTGIGARELAGDKSLVPVRGQLVLVANPDLDAFFVGDGADGEVTYIFPHGRTVVLGGTHQHGAASLRPDQGDARRILDRCAAVERRLARAQVLAHRVGLRPVRPSVRLGAEPAGDGRHVIHCYGHGGAGVTLSWGCALDVAALAEQLS